MTNIWPGNPTPGGKAAADRKVACASAAAARLLKREPTSTPDRALAVVQLAYGPVIDAVADIDEEVGNGDLESAAFLLIGELVRRLHEVES